MIKKVDKTNQVFYTQLNQIFEGYTNLYKLIKTDTGKCWKNIYPFLYLPR